MNVRNLINYYQLAQVLPLEKALEREECENRIKTDYLGAINDIVTAVKNEKCVQVTAGQSQAKGSHALLLIGINKETEDFVDMQVWDPNQVEIKSLYMYKDKGNIEDAIRISTDAYGDRFTDFINGFLESIILIREIILEWTIMKCFRIIRIMKKHICK